jgi:hypothetical protein
MKTIKALFAVSLMVASVAAMAEGGGDRVMAQMQASRDVAMAHYEQAHKATVVASHSATPDTGKSGLAVHKAQN